MRSIGFIKSSPGIPEHILFVSEGMREYTPSDYNQFKIPFSWLSFHLIVLFIIGDYINKDLGGVGIQMILRSSNKTYWLFGKTIYCLTNVTGAYVIQFAIVSVYCIFSKNSRFNIDTDIWTVFFGINPSYFSVAEILAGLVFLPLLTSFTLSLLHLMLSLIMKPIYSFTVAAVYLISSAYIKNYILIGNFSMLLRNEKLCANGLNQKVCIYIDLILCLLSIILSARILKKYDLIEKR